MDRIKEFYEDYKSRILIGFILILIFFILILMFFSKNSYQNENDQYFAKNSSNIMSNDHDKEDVDKPKVDNKIYVDVKGAVKSPGVYEVTSQMRLSDAIELASGFNHSADVNHVNLSKKLVDQEVIYIPIKGEVKGSPASLNESSSKISNDDNSDNGETNKVNLNSAEKNDLTTLNGIGDKKADQIIDFRKQNGPFSSVDDLKKVPGFGDKTVDNLRSFVSV